MNIYDEFINSNKPDEIIDYFQGKPKDKEIDYYNGKMPARQIKSQLSKPSEKVYNFIRRIVDFKAQYLFGKGIELENLDQNKITGFENFSKSWNDLKIVSHYVELATSLFAYGECAEIIILSDDNKVRHYPLTKDKDDFYPFFENDGSLGAFARFFSVKELIDNEIVNVPNCQIYTNEYNYIFEEKNSWKLTKEPEPILKMPVVYYSTTSVVDKIQDQQDGYNELANELSDVNSQASYPFLVMKGYPVNIQLNGDSLQNKPVSEQTTAYMDKLHTGALKGVALDGDDNGADFKIVSWDKEPKTLMFELENLYNLMFKFSSVPDVSFENLKGFNNISGFALQFLFLDAEIAKNGDFLIFFELKRAINLHKFYGNFDTDLKAIPKSFLPKDQENIINSLAVSRASNQISQQTAVSKNPFVTNPIAELETIETEKENQLNDITAESFE